MTGQPGPTVGPSDAYRTPGEPVRPPWTAPWEPDQVSRSRTAPPVGTERRSGRFGSWVARYGWRVYAIPVLTLLTIVALTRGVTSPRPATAAALRARPPAPVQLALSPDGSPCTTNTLAQFILVSIREQRIWMCQGATQVYSSLVTTGAINVGDATPLGTWHIQDKQVDRYLVGPGYRDFVHYWMPFDGDFGFHDAPWQTMPYGAPGYTANGSHGCVHLPEAAMAWLYRWAPTGTTVTIAAGESENL